jgi:hypothetical protein
MARSVDGHDETKDKRVLILDQWYQIFFCDASQQNFGLPDIMATTGSR